MTHSRPGLFALAALALFSAGASPATAAPPGGASAGESAPPISGWRNHPYGNAIATLANYGSCGVHRNAATYAGLNAELHALEAAALAKGLGPVLERVRRDYEAFMAVADVMACGGGPERALAQARGAVAAFRAWVEAQPGG